MKNRPTVSLQMIVKDEVDAVFELLKTASPFFDKVNLTVSDFTALRRLEDKIHAVMWKNVNIEYRDWNDRFDDARNSNLKMCTTDYFFWLDADDQFDFRAIPQLVDIASENDIDAIFLPYNYAQDDDGNCVTRHWRERLIRNNGDFEWRGWVHETCISDTPYKSHKVNFEVKHTSSPDHAKDSVERNHAILEKAYAATDDPRYLHYLGMSYFTHGDYEKSASLLTDYLNVGGSVEDSYRALATISECAYHLKKYDLALEYATKCATLKPEYPMAYWLLAQYEADQENWHEALEWIRVSEAKPNPETLSVWDPTSRERAVLIAAQAEFMLGNYNTALAWLRKIPKNKTAQDLIEHFQNEADAETFVTLLPKMRKFFKDDKTLWDALCNDIAYDNRILSLRQLVNEPKAWADKSIVIFCGQGYEEWGPHTLGKGMGGSEEAVVYLSRELAKLGYIVTVYGEANLTEFESTVIWRPWKEIDTRDRFNVFVAWRSPQYLDKISAKVKLADIHDVLPPQVMKDYSDVTYLVKSAYHRSLTPKLADEKFKIIGNGIKKDQFNV